MKKTILLISIIYFCGFSAFAQEIEKTTQFQLKSLSSKQQLELTSLPELKLPSSYKNKSIPYEVDNTLQTCYSGLFLQSGLCCGQAASVGNGFTYEINRVRNLNGTLVQNKYPTHFTWNWENGGEGYYGASYYHSLVVLKKVGNPNMQVYGGTHDFGGATRFMSGYDSYYEAMQNRISAAYAINCSTEEGIITLKNWLNDHLEGSDVGGIGFFYSQHQNPSTLLPVGTEHAGEKVCTTWATGSNHAMTITGYNDSIRWDYNGDGLYTNNLDITDDGIVDVRDWEIGGFKMCNTYGSPYNGWMMYRSLALSPSGGGIWNNTVNVLYAIKEYSPELTYKVNLYYTNRLRIKVLAGMSTNLAATEPDYYMTFPIFDYQGSEWGMQGANDEVSRQIEFGLDVTPFLNLIPTGTPVKFFFQIHENDTEGWGTGQIQSFSVMDYTSGSAVEYASAQTNVDVIQNGVTSVSVNHTPNFSKPEITTDVLPTANVYHPYSYQMEAASGTAPYRWEFDQDYVMAETSTPLASATSALSGTLITLPFDFPFYGETYNYFYLNSKGYIDFSGESYSLPYNSNTWTNNTVSFIHRKCIAPFFSPGSCTTTYASGADFYIIRWVATNIDVSLKLESNGKITIFYNNCTPINSQVWTSGFSFGNLSDYSLTPVSGATTNLSSVGYEFLPMSKPEVFELSEDGLLTGTPLVEMLAYPLNFKVTDAKGLVNRKTIPISTDGLIIGYDIVTPNNTLIEWGENVDMNLNLRNATTGTINNLVVSLTCDNPNVTFTDDIQNVGMLNPMQEIDINTAFNFNLNYNFYNEEEITLHLTAEATENTWEIDIVLPVYTSDIITTEYFVDDSDNNRLDIGETSDVYYVFKNNGGAALDNINITVTTVDPFITINTNSDNIGSLIPTQTGNAYFNFTASSECLPGHVALLNFHITGANGYEKDIVGHLSVGQIIENWETNTFDTYNWTLGGDLPWIITDVAPYEGAYCLKSGAITHDQNSTIEIELEVISAGSISFYKKVSSETNYDFLKFYVDGIEKGSWSGTQDWSLQSYGVAAGVRNFKWVYSKDNTVSSGSDCAWIDLIEFPSIYDTEPILTLSTESINKVMYQDEIDVDTMYISNMGGGIIDYNLEILSNISWGKSQKNISGSFMTCSNQSFFAGDAVDWTFTAKNMGTDNEWIEGASANFPEGFMINTVTDMYDESTDTLHLVSGVPGDGADFAWFGEQTDGWGLIQVNETAHFHLTGNISEAFEGNMKVYYTLQGEVYGAEPHIVNDSITILNYGPRVEWFYSSTNNGDLGIGQSDLLLLEFNTWGLTPGIYECNLNVFASCDTVVIPVTLTVLNPVNVGNLLVENFSVYPNPSHDNFVVEAGFKFEKIELVNLLGQVVLSKEISSSKCVIQTSDIVPGVYFVNVFTDSGIRTKKLVIE